MPISAMCPRKALRGDVRWPARSSRARWRISAAWLVDRTDRHEALARPSRRLAGRVVLVAPDIRLHMRRRQQSNLVPELDQRPPPMVSRGARLHRHQTPRQFGEESHQPAARELARDDSLALRVDSVNLKRVLRQIEPDPRDSGDIPDRLAHGRLPCRWVDDNDHLGTLMPFGAPSTPSP